MKRLLFYSHDTYGLGNIRRTLSICKALHREDPDLSILIISGSPVVHRFPMPEGIDYVKLPCLTRTEKDGYAPKYLSQDSTILAQLRADIIRCAVADFQPDIVLVDKKPCGIQNELQPSLLYLQEHLPDTKIFLLLRDILDAPSATSSIWRKNGFFEAIDQFYDEILVLGLPQIFDPRVEYEFPPSVSTKVRFCGYLEREPGRSPLEAVKTGLGLSQTDPLVLVTAGGGEDGTQVFQTYLDGLLTRSEPPRFHSLLVFGPEMAEADRTRLLCRAQQAPKVHTLNFTDDLMSFMAAADVIVSMGGYGTVCEIFTLHKPAIVIPRTYPVEEQWIRARRMAQLGLVRYLNPATLTPAALRQSVEEELRTPARGPSREIPGTLLGGIPALMGAIADGTPHELEPAEKSLTRARWPEEEAITEDHAKAEPHAMLALA